jgi:hypothetical protein
MGWKAKQQVHQGPTQAKGLDLNLDLPGVRMCSPSSVGVRWTSLVTQRRTPGVRQFANDAQQ